MEISVISLMLLSYLSGSIPYGLVLVKLVGKSDIRQIGSGNIGTTNVLRAGGKMLAFLTLVLDIGKAFTPALIATSAFGVPAGILVGTCAFIGHIFPIWLRFKGGKGVATYIGVLLGVEWRLGLIFCLLWLLTALITRYSSLSALIAATLIPLVQMIFWPSFFLNILLFMMSALLIYKHKENIARLIQGQEKKIGQKQEKKIGQKDLASQDEEPV